MGIMFRRKPAVLLVWLDEKFIVALVQVLALVGVLNGTHEAATTCIALTSELLISMM